MDNFILKCKSGENPDYSFYILESQNDSFDITYRQ